MSNIKRVLSILNSVASSSAKARNWKEGFSRIINPRIELSQAAIYISKSQDSYMDAELEVFMVQIANENGWYSAGKMEKLEEEKKLLRKTVHSYLTKITDYFNDSKKILYDLSSYSQNEITEAENYYNSNKSLFGGLRDDKVINFTDRVSHIYRIQDILKPLATALLIHNFLLEDFEGSYENRYNKLSKELAKSGYTLREEDKLLLEIRNNANQIQLTIDQLEDFIIR
jgi:hypothetical protein